MKQRFAMGLFIVLACIACPGRTQPDLRHDYIPQWNSFPADSSILYLQRKFMLWVPKAKIENRSALSFFAQHMKSKAEFVHDMKTRQLLLATDSMTVLLNQLVAHIVQHNQSLQGRQFQVYTLRSAVSNAYSVGEGVILVSNTLLSRVSSLDQIAFILAHEMAHDVQNHVFINAINYCEGLFDGDLRKEVRKARRSPVSRQTAVKDIVYGYLAEHMEYSREMEFEADSMGLIYARNAGFTTHATKQFFLEAKDVSNFSFSDTSLIADAFDFDAFPFQERWLIEHDHEIPWQPDSTILYGPDSLSTHPEMEARIDRIQKYELHQSSDDAVSKAIRLKFDADKKAIWLELVTGLLQTGDFADALYITLNLRKQYPENVFLHSAVVHCLSELRHKMVKGDYLEVVDFPRMTHGPGYNQLLAFLHNLNSDMLGRCITLYEQKFLASHQDHPYVRFLHHLNGDPESLKQELNDRYASGQRDSFYTFMLERRYKEYNPQQVP